MRHRAWLAVGMLAALTGPARAQETVGSLENLYDKAPISETDRQQMRQWLGAVMPNLVASTDPERKQMVASRDLVLQQVRRDFPRSADFLQAFGEEALRAIQAVEKKAVSEDARINLVMVVAGLQVLEAVPLLEAALVKDPFPASRYWAAKGLATVAPLVVQKTQPRLEQAMADAAAKVFDAQPANVTLLHLFDMLGKLDHDRAREVLAEGGSKAVTFASASDPVAARALGVAVAGLERAYAREMRPEGKTRVMAAYATMCAWILPPVADPGLMESLNVSLEKITGAKVGFVAGESQSMQKIALMEWVEKLFREKRIAKRPALPPSVEQAVRELGGAGVSAGGVAQP